MAGIIQYTLSLNDRVSEKMKKIGVENMKQVEGWNKVQQKVQTTEQVMQKCADSVGSVVSRINGLQDAILSSILSPFASLPAQIMSVFDPVFEWIHGAIDAVGVWFENNKELITGIMTVIAGVISSVVNVVGQAVSVVVGTFGEFWARVQEGDPIATRLAATMGILATALLVAAARAKLMAMWSGIVSAAKAVWAAVQGGLNLALLACPITWIITAIIALIAVIAYVCYKVEG